VTKPKKELTTEKRLLTAREAAQVLGFKTPAPVYKLIADGKLPKVELPVRGGARIDQRDLDAFIERRKNVA